MNFKPLTMLDELKAAQADGLRVEWSWDGVTDWTEATSPSFTLSSQGTGQLRVEVRDEVTAEDDELQDAWPHPISGWVRDGDFVPVSGADTESRLAQGWQPVSHVPPSFVFDPSRPAQRYPDDAVAAVLAKVVKYRLCRRPHKGAKGGFIPSMSTNPWDQDDPSEMQWVKIGDVIAALANLEPKS